MSLLETIELSKYYSTYLENVRFILERLFIKCMLRSCFQYNVKLLYNIFYFIVNAKIHENYLVNLTYIKIKVIWFTSISSSFFFSFLLGTSYIAISVLCTSQRENKIYTIHKTLSPGFGINICKCSYDLDCIIYKIIILRVRVLL